MQLISNGEPHDTTESRVRLGTKLRFSPGPRLNVPGEDEEEAVRSKARKRVRFQDDVAAVAPAERGELDGRSGTSVACLCTGGSGIEIG